MLYTKHSKTGDDPVESPRETGDVSFMTRDFGGQSPSRNSEKSAGREFRLGGVKRTAAAPRNRFRSQIIENRFSYAALNTAFRYSAL
ncbi:hypothetical protein DBV15_12489 [Temnothorax longispinosus]|uniref:Uncharacterized protein n=1 Tax=Temnothorax longispinosus TaxID=300112 RepID=A0A4S2KHZ2_9HYME|nr:hypothetical protein DBV15_12489 [Temnothorax longispinosus]